MLASQRDSQGGAIRPPVLLKVDDGHVQTFTLSKTTGQPDLLRKNIFVIAK